MPLYYFGPGDAKERFQYWLDHKPPFFAIDTETVSLENRRPLGFAIAFSPVEAFYFDLRAGDLDRELQLIKPWLTDPMILKIGHNMMFDLGILPLIFDYKIDRTNIFDTNIAARLLGRIETSLPLLAWDVKMSTTGMATILKEHGCSDNICLTDKVPMILAEHCQQDAKVTFALWLEWHGQIEKQYPEYFQVEMRAIPIVLDVSMKGLLIDQTARKALDDKYGKEVEFYGNIIKSMGVQNPNSPQQIGYTLAKRGSFLKMSRNKKSLSTRAGDLEFLSDPMAAATLHYRHYAKFKNTYLDPLEGEDRFFTEYYFDTSVGRMNSRNRNIQNIPLDARYMILPDNGVFTTGDYSREHLYILANKSQDRDLLAVLYNPDPKKTDLHQFTADMMGVPRSLAKTLNFAVVYGATAQTVAEQAKIRDLHRCQGLIDRWFRVYRGAADWIQQVQEEGIHSGWAVPTVFGRRIKLPDENRDGQMRKAVNYPILGSDGEVLKRALILCERRGLGPAAGMAILVHDSITWDGDTKSRIPLQELEHIPKFRIPFEVKQTFRWE